MLRFFRLLDHLDGFQLGLPRQDQPRGSYDGNRLGRILGRPGMPGPSCSHDDIDLETHQLGREPRLPLGPPLRKSVLDGDVLSFYVAKLAQS